MIQRLTAPTVVMLAALLLLAGCQSFPPPDRANARPEQQLDVPFVAQRKYQCGPAALAMMLQWANQPVSADSLVKEVWLPKRKGSLGMELEGAARARGLMAYPVRSPDALFKELQVGRPVLILQNLALPSLPQWHYAVVTGYYKGGERIVLHSGTHAHSVSIWNRFIRTWARADLWGFTLVAPGQLPASASADGLFAAITPLPNSAQFWPAAVKAFPDSGKLWFGQGNALWAAGDPVQATLAFEKATELAPDFAAAWNNLAYAYEQAGQLQSAHDSICQAHALAPHDQAINASVDELVGQSGCD
ncbi:MAG: PA2778 family cysteine peptidase [Alcanivorax sp.]|nr:PA2778 family cysteine peptidase [Alcanivorax sp.]